MNCCTLPVQWHLWLLCCGCLILLYHTFQADVQCEKCALFHFITFISQYFPLIFPKENLRNCLFWALVNFILYYFQTHLFYTWTLHLKTWKQFEKNISLFWYCTSVVAKKKLNNSEKKCYGNLNLHQGHWLYLSFWLLQLLQKNMVNYACRCVTLPAFVFVFVFKYCLLGVTDDRGKFIYISPEELEAVAKFIKQRGRVTISELAESSNTLVNLQADHTHTHTPSTAQVSA